MAKRKPLLAIARFMRFAGTHPGRRLAIVKGQDAGRWTDFYHLVLIAPWSVFFLGLALVFVELLVSSEGLGYLLVYSRNLMQLDVVMVCMAAIGLVGLLFDLALTRLERHFSNWSPKGY